MRRPFERGQGKISPKQGKRGPRKFCYTYQDFANLTGMSVNGISKAAARGEFDLHSKKSVLLWAALKVLSKDLRTQSADSTPTTPLDMPEIVEIPEN